MSIVSQQKLNVSWTKLRIREGMNARTDDQDPTMVDALARSIAENGLDHDVTVIESQTEPGCYEITAGFTRTRALLCLAANTPWPEDRLVTVTVLKYTSGVDPFIRNLVENVQRRDLRSADIAKRCFELSEGLCSDSTGAAVEKVSVQSLADSLGKSASFVRELVRAWRGASEGTRAAWQSEVIATDQARAWCKLSPEKQEEKLAAFLAGEEEPKKPAKNGKSSSKNGHAEEDEDEDDSHETRAAKAKSDEAKPPTRGELSDRAADIAAKLDAGEYKTQTEKAAARAAWQALRWAAGEVRRLSLS